MDRGWYAGPVGWMDAAEDGEFCVALRSALLRDRTAHLFAGAGIVADSDPAAELAETELKLEALLPLLAGLAAGAPGAESYSSARSTASCAAVGQRPVQVDVRGAVGDHLDQPGPCGERLGEVVEPLEAPMRRGRRAPPPRAGSTARGVPSRASNSVAVELAGLGQEARRCRRRRC